MFLRKNRVIIEIEMETNPTLLHTLAQQALAHYALHYTTLEYINHSETVTYKVVDESGQPYLLRLHLPRIAAMGNHGTNPNMVRSELLWLAALKRNGLPVQQPVENSHSDLVTTLNLPNGEQVNCTLLEWIPGEVMERSMETEDTAAQMGELVGKIHLHSSRWRRPRGFTRPRRNAAYFDACLDLLRPAIADGRINISDFNELASALEKLKTLMRKQPKTRQSEGLLHGDLHRANFIYDNGHIGLIDFSLCCTGSYMFDLGICLSGINQNLHPIFLLNYDRFFPLPARFPELIEGYFIGGYICTLSFWVNDPEAQELFVQRVPYVAAHFAAPFNRDERFWFIPEQK